MNSSSIKSNQVGDTGTMLRTRQTADKAKSFQCRAIAFFNVGWVESSRPTDDQTT